MYSLSLAFEVVVVIAAVVAVVTVVYVFALVITQYTIKAHLPFPSNSSYL